MVDIAIIGGGPAGLAAGIYAIRGGASVRLYEEMFCGGQITKTHRIENYPGLCGLDGYTLASKFEQHAQELGLEPEFEPVTGLKLGEKKLIITEAGTLEVKTVILCTGAEPRKLNIEGEEAFTGHGVSYCATCDGAFYKSKTVAVVGGGDTAVTDALYLATMAERVYLIHRRDELRAVGRAVETLKNTDNIELILNAVPAKITGDKRVTGLELMDKLTGETRAIALDGVFAAVGVVPRTELFKEQLALTQSGSVITNERMETSEPGVFAAGDVRDTPLRQVVTACADGATAATYAIEHIRAYGL